MPKRPLRQAGGRRADGALSRQGDRRHQQGIMPRLRIRIPGAELLERIEGGLHRGAERRGMH
jgi:hypothetical protein